MGSLRRRWSVLWLVSGILLAGGTPRTALAEAPPPQASPPPAAEPVTRAPAAVNGAPGGVTPEHRGRGRTVSPDPLILLRSAGATLRTTF
jgi:hypothetical protein